MGSLRGRHSKGKGKGIRAQDHARGRREEGRAPRAPHALWGAQIPPSPSHLLTPTTQATLWGARGVIRKFILREYNLFFVK